MASLEILDGAGISRDLLVTAVGSDLVPHHIVESSALPTGAATEATLATIDADTGSIVGYVDGIETLLGTIDTDTGAIATSTASIDGKITACNTGAVVLAAGTANIGDVDVLSLPALPAGSNNIGDVDVLSLPSIPAGTNNIGDVDVLSLPALVASSATIGDVALVGRASGGLTLHSRLSTGTDSTNVKASAGQVFWGFVTNTNAAARYIKFYNSASAPTLGSGTPIARFMIPPNSSGLQITAEQGLTFSTGIGYTLSTGAADSDTGTVAANEVIVNLGYR